ncbi:MAG: CBS domain-containing protein, partial [Rubrobacteraceae bacterium]
MEPEETPRKDIRVEDIMRPAVTVSPDVPAREALRLLRENNVPGIPVVDESGKLEGFVTDGHLLESALPRYMKMMETISFVP